MIIQEHDSSERRIQVLQSQNQRDEYFGNSISVMVQCNL